MPDRTNSRVARAATLASLLLALLLGTAVPALAHADLLATFPASGASVDALDQFELQFTEPVTVLPQAIRVLDADGEAVAVGTPFAQGDAVIVPTAGLPEGAYVVSWRVVSADGHPVQGSTTFGLGVPAGAGAAIAAGTAPDPLRAAAIGLEVLAALAVAGAALSRRVVLRRPDHVAVADLLIGRAAVAGLVLGAALLPVRSAELLGTGLLEAMAPDSLAAFVGTTVGRSAALRLLAFAAVLGLGRLTARPAARVATGLAAATTAASFAIDGHTRTVDSWLLGTGADLVHLAAGAAWFGGLLVLAVVLRGSRRPDAVEVATIVGRFSAVATVAVVAVTGAGAVLADAILPAGVVLGDSAYGTALLAKTAIVSLLVAIGAYNHVALVPATRRAARPVLAGGSAEVLPTPVGLRLRRRRQAADAATTSLRRTLRLELGAFVAVLLLTGGLVDLSPPAPTTASTVTAYLDLGGGVSAKFDATVDASGPEVVDVRLIGPLGQAVSAERLTLFLRNDALGIPPTPVDLEATGPGTWNLVGDVITLAGTWDIDVVARLTRFSEEGTGVVVEVPSAAR